VANAKIQSRAADQKWRQGVLIKPSPKLKQQQQQQKLQLSPVGDF